jgi:hypothetical protein
MKEKKKLNNKYLKRKEILASQKILSDKMSDKTERILSTKQIVLDL